MILYKFFNYKAEDILLDPCYPEPEYTKRINEICKNGNLIIFIPKDSKPLYYTPILSTSDYEKQYGKEYLPDNLENYNIYKISGIKESDVTSVLTKKGLI